MNTDPQPYTAPRKVAVWALVLSIVAIILMTFYWPAGLLFAFLSLIFGTVGRKGPGRPLATAAIVCGLASLLLWLYMALFVGVIFNPLI